MQTGHYDLGHLGGVIDGRALEWFVAAEGNSDPLCKLQVQGGTGGNVSAAVAKPQ